MTPTGLIFLILGLLAISSAADIPVLGTVLPTLEDLAVRGQRLTTCTSDANGVVNESPDDLANAASAVVGRTVTVDAYSGARMVRSEEGSAGETAKSYLVHVCLNLADQAGTDLTGFCTQHNTGSRDGHYGKQISGQVSTTQDPYENDLAASEYALAQRAQGIDATGGALHFVDKAAFGVQVGAASSFDTFLASTTFGTPGNLPNAPDHLVFFWPGDLPDQAVPL